MNNWKDYAKMAVFAVVIIVAGIAAYQVFAAPAVDKYKAGQAGAVTV